MLVGGCSCDGFHSRYGEVGGRWVGFAVDEDFGYIEAGTQLGEGEGALAGHERERFAYGVVVVINAVAEVPFRLLQVVVLHVDGQGFGLAVDAQGEAVDVAV